MAGNYRNRWWKWVLVTAVVVIGVGFGIWYLRRDREDTPQYETVPVKRGDITQVVTATGTLNPVDDPLSGSLNVTVGSQVSGLITKLFVDFNSVVKSNQVMAEIDPTTYEAQLNQAQANLAYAKANLELQQVEVVRDAQLYTNKLLDASDYDTAVATRDEAAAQVQIQEAAVTNAAANLSYCKVRSPVDGVVISRAVDVGQTVASSFNTPTLFQIANSLKEMQIDAAVDEGDIGGVKDGQEVDFTVDAYPNRTFHGVVKQVRNAPTTVNNVVTYDTIISVKNADLKLKPGMIATVSIIVADLTNILQIPNSALRFQPVEMAGITPASGAAAAARPSGGGNRPADERPGGPGRRHDGKENGEQPVVRTIYVMTKGANGDTKLEPVQINIGITDNINTQVVSGLKEGDQVVTGLAIPGLGSANGSQNPFAFQRRF
ncbi:MAG: efflux RND transporter periplasmic adaptor subunit [Limisphaerales bacterium]